MKKCLLILIVCAFTWSLATPSQASLLSVDVSGTLDVDSTLNGVAIGLPTQFSYHSVIDSTSGVNIFSNYYQYAANTRLNINGHGIYTSSNVCVVLADNSLGFDFIVGLINGPDDFSGTVWNYYITATPEFTGDSPIVSVFSNSNGSAAGGTFVFDGNNTWHPSFYGNVQAAINDVSAVPEPSTFILLGAGLGGLALLRRKSQK